MKLLIYLFILFFADPIFSQIPKDYGEKFHKNLDCETLKELTCIEAPTGIYAIKFKVKRGGKFGDFVASNKSLEKLNQIFISAIIKSVSKYSHIDDGSYVQLFYFFNFNYCNVTSHVFKSESKKDSLLDLNNINSELINQLSQQIESIHSSWRYMQKMSINEKVFVLPFLYIDCYRSSLGNKSYNNSN